MSRENRRARLIQAAVRVLLRRGYQATQVHDVAREARVARGTFYRHFQSKRELLASVAGELVESLPTRFSTPSAPRTRAGLEELLKSLHVATLQAFHDARDAATLLFGEGRGTEPSVAKALAAHDRAWRRLLLGLLAKAREAGLLREGISLPLAVDSIIGGVQRIVRTAILTDERPDIQAFASGLARLQMASLCPDSR